MTFKSLIPILADVCHGANKSTAWIFVFQFFKICQSRSLEDLMLDSEKTRKKKTLEIMTTPVILRDRLQREQSSFFILGELIFVH